MTPNTTLEAALQVLRELAPQGHSFGYISKALELRGVPTLSGRGAWNRGVVYDLAKRHGIRIAYGVRVA